MGFINLIKGVIESYLFLLILQILYKFFTKKKVTQKKQKLTYIKYTENAAPSDIVFQKNDWKLFQFMKYYFNKNIKQDILIKRLSSWAFDTWSLPLNYRIIENMSSNEYCGILYQNTKPKSEIINTTHLVLCFPNEQIIIILMDHYYCDGIIMVNMLKYLTTYNKEFNALTYKYIPFITEIMMNNFIIRNTITSLFNHSNLDFSGNPVFLSEEFDKKTLGNDVLWNRWSIYARGLMHAFNCCPKQVKNLNIAFTVAINDVSIYRNGNNRIGCIIITIQKPNNFYVNSYKQNFTKLSQVLKDKIIRNSKDAMLSYHLINSYPTHKFRKYFSQNIDLVFTAFKIDDDMPQIIKSEGGFFGNHKFYIGACTYNSRCHLTITTTIKGWESRTFLENSKAGRMLII